MGQSYFVNPAVFLIQTLFGLYILVVMLRFLFQLTHADFYNPISQFIVKITSPVLRYVRRMVPSFAGLDLAALVLAWLLKTIELGLVVVLSGASLNLLGPLLWAIPELVGLTINIFLFAILIQVVLSWIKPGGYNPALGLLHNLTDPLLAPAQRILPPLGGLDLSPMLVMVGLVLLEMLLLPPLRMLTGSPF